MSPPVRTRSRNSATRALCLSDMRTSVKSNAPQYTHRLVPHLMADHFPEAQKRNGTRDASLRRVRQFYGNEYVENGRDGEIRTPDLLTPSIFFAFQRPPPRFIRCHNSLIRIELLAFPA